MRYSKKFILMFLVLMSAVFFTSCGKKDYHNMLEVAVKPDADIVFALDYTNPDQMKNVQALLKEFPETGLFDRIDGEISELDFKKDLYPILKKPWKAVFVVNLTKGFLTAQQQNPETAVPDVYMLAKFEKIQPVEALLNKWFDREAQERENVKTWSRMDSPTVAMTYEDVLILADNEDSADRALGLLRAETVELPDYVADLDAASKDRVGYFYLNKDFLSEIVNDTSTDGQADVLKEALGVMGNNLSVVKAEKSGLRFLSLTEVEDEKFLGSFYLKGLNTSGLLGKINSDGLLAYSSGRGLGDFLNNFWSSFASDFNQSLAEQYQPAVDDQSPEVSDKLLRQALEEKPPAVLSTQGYQDFILQLTGSTNLTEDDVKTILDSPFAFAFSDVKAMLPALVLYFDLDSQYVDKAKDITLGLDVYIDNVLEKLNESQPGLFKKEVEVVNGAGLHKLYLDWDAMSEDVKSGFAFVPGTKKLELYYGVTGDGILVFALYPDFPAAYGKSPLSKDKGYLSAVKNIKGLEIDSYVNFSAFSELVARYWGIAQLAMGMQDTENADFEILNTILTEVLPTFRYSISGYSYKDKVLKVESFIKIDGEDNL